MRGPSYPAAAKRALSAASATARRMNCTKRGMAAITAEGGWGIPFIKPWEGEELERKMCRAAATGTRVLGMDIDAAGLIALARMGRPVSPKTCAELAAIVVVRMSLCGNSYSRAS